MGLWGLPAALQLQDRGYLVTLIDRFKTNGPYASNGGLTRLWRLVDTHAWRMRAIMQTLPTMERLEQRLRKPIFTRAGILWRDGLALANVMQALREVNQPFDHLGADTVGDCLPGLRPDGRDALFVEAAGVVFVDELLTGCLRSFLDAGGQYVPHGRVTSITPGSSSVTVRTQDGQTRSADQLLLAAGPGTPELLPHLDVKLPLRAYIEQVVYFGADDTSTLDELPAIVDCAIGEGPAPRGSTEMQVWPRYLELNAHFASPATGNCRTRWSTGRG